MYQFVDKHQACECLSCCDATLRRYRAGQEWIEGIHWIRINSRVVRYNLELLRDWQANRHDQMAHQKAILLRRRCANARYQSLLEANQKKYKC